MFDILIIGAGPAGFTAAIYATRANKKVAIISSDIGGQLMKTTHVENYPGFKSILGPQLMQNMQEQALSLGAQIITDAVIDFKKNGSYFNVLGNSQEYQSKVLIIATGSKPKMLGFEEEFIGYGVSTCATCDGAFFRNKKIAVIGGGNSALEEASYLSAIGSKVYLIHRRMDFRGEKIMQDRVFKNEKIEVLNPFVVEKFEGKPLNSLVIKNVETGESRNLEVSAAFIAIGHTPNTDFLKGKVNLDSEGYCLSSDIPGLFFAGDCVDKKYRQAITAAGLGCMASLDALKYLESV